MFHCICFFLIITLASAFLLSSVDNNLFALRCRLLAVAAYAGSVEVDTAAQWEAAARGQIPRHGVYTCGTAAADALVPKHTTCEVVDLNGKGTWCAGTVKGKDESGLGSSGI